MVSKKEITKKADELSKKISSLCIEFTTETGSVITSLTFTPDISLLGDSGLSNVKYNVSFDYMLPEGETNEIN